MFPPRPPLQQTPPRLGPPRPDAHKYKLSLYDAEKETDVVERFRRGLPPLKETDHDTATASPHSSVGAPDSVLPSSVMVWMDGGPASASGIEIVSSSSGVFFAPRVSSSLSPPTPPTFPIRPSSSSSPSPSPSSFSSYSSPFLASASATAATSARASSSATGTTAGSHNNAEGTMTATTSAGSEAPRLSLWEPSPPRLGDLTVAAPSSSYREPTPASLSGAQSSLTPPSMGASSRSGYGGGGSGGGSGSGGRTSDRGREGGRGLPFSAHNIPVSTFMSTARSSSSPLRFLRAQGPSSSLNSKEAQSSLGAASLGDSDDAATTTSSSSSSSSSSSIFTDYDTRGGALVPAPLSSLSRHSSPQERYASTSALTGEEDLHHQRVPSSPSVVATEDGVHEENSSKALEELSRSVTANLIGKYVLTLATMPTRHVILFGEAAATPELALACGLELSRRADEHAQKLLAKRPLLGGERNPRGGEEGVVGPRGRDGAEEALEEESSQGGEYNNHHSPPLQAHGRSSSPSETKKKGERPRREPAEGGGQPLLSTPKEEGRSMAVSPWELSEARSRGRDEVVIGIGNGSTTQAYIDFPSHRHSRDRDGHSSYTSSNRSAVSMRVNGGGTEGLPQSRRVSRLESDYSHDNMNALIRRFRFSSLSSNL